MESREHNGHQHPGYSFIPASVETQDYLGKPLASYIKPSVRLQQAEGRL